MFGSTDNRCFLRAVSIIRTPVVTIHTNYIFDRVSLSVLTFRLTKRRGAITYGENEHNYPDTATGRPDPIISDTNGLYFSSAETRSFNKK